MKLIKDRCTGCGYCVLVCPYDALRTNGWAEVIPANCTDCNLCVYACPNDCFAPDVPLRPYQPRVKDDYEVLVIGSGLGGLMAATALAQAGRRVAVFEKLGFPGGRYTELDYKGAAVTTGAWTNLGPHSHIDRFLTELGLKLDYVSLADAGLTEQYAIRFPDGRHYASLFDMLDRPARQAWLKAIADGRRRPAEALARLSTAAYIAQYSDDPQLMAAVEAIVATASGLPADRIPAAEYIQITLDARQAGREFAMPRGGVRAIIKALTGALRRAGGELFLRSPVAQILVSAGVAGGVQLANGRRVRSRVVLHNGGPGRLIELVGAEHLPQDYLDHLERLQGVEVAALFGATRRPLFSDAPITMTPGCRRVVGIFLPTVLDPTLSKAGLSLFDAFFPLHSADRAAELELALADLRALFPDFDEVVVWTAPMFFTGDWPGAESGQTFGQTGELRLDPATPIKNCFLVGMDVKGSGVAGDLIPLGVRRVVDAILERT
ncbi:MAG: FAD-dependent oxidoreductase [Chloroflexota bacterium]